MVKQKDWFAEFKGKQKLREAEVKLLNRRLNDGKVRLNRVRTGGYALTQVQVDKVNKWLKSKCFTPRGAVREMSEFGWREVDILKTLKTIRLQGFELISSYGEDAHYVPVYRVIRSDDDFIYYVPNSGIVTIVG